MTPDEGNVVPLNGALGATARGGKPNQVLIELLEKALAQAQRGELQCAIMVKLFADGDMTDFWSTHVVGDAKRLLGQLRMTEHDIVTSIANAGDGS